MNADRLTLVVAAAVCLSACGAAPARQSLRVDIFNDAGATAAPRPTAVAVSWLDIYGYLFQDRVFAIPAGTGDYLGNVLVRMYVADVGLRRVIVRGQAGGQTVSEGWGISDPEKGESERPVAVTLAPVPAGAADLDDGDKDHVPDPVDNCLGLANPMQLPGDCS
jgi:hypothetical protein